MRYLFLLHRYLGIAVSALMVLWALSGAVMLYVSYPSLPEEMRIAALQPLHLSNCCQAAQGALSPDAQISGIHVEMLNQHAIAEISTNQGTQVVELESGRALPRLSMQDAAAVARSFALRWDLPAAPLSAAKISDDQWTVSEQFAPDRPLYKFSWSDAKRSELYISSLSGQAVQFTTRSIRFWNWLGAVPHWVYFTALRRHASAWAQFVILTSVLGCFLTMTGIYIGFRQYLHRGPDRFSPYRGFMAWHHLTGLFFGALAFLWVMSGLLSMNPWGILESSGDGLETKLLQGRAPDWRELQRALGKIALQPAASSIVSLRSANLDSEIFFVATYADGHRVRFNGEGAPAPLSTSNLIIEERLLGGDYQASPELMHVSDNFYFSHHSDTVSFPVYRVLAKNADQTRYYLDPVTGEILKKADANGRAFRWLHAALHRLDFSAAIRDRPGWYALMLLLLCGVSLLSVTGCYAAIRRMLNP